MVAAEIKSPVAKNPVNLDNTITQTNHTVVNTSDIQGTYIKGGHKRTNFSPMSLQHCNTPRWKLFVFGFNVIVDSLLSDQYSLLRSRQYFTDSVGKVRTWFSINLKRITF